MKIILVGASGTIGKKVYERLATRHEVIKASAHQGNIIVDITNRASIERMYKAVPNVDAVVCAAGGAHFGPFDNMTEDDFYIGIRDKMMGQINLVMVGKDYINDRGSFTLITGILAEDPIRMGLGLSMVNGAVNAFVKATAIELKRNLRINVVCPGLVEDAVEKYARYFPGHNPVSMERVVKGYIRSIEGANTGQVIKIY